jgi:hypothetical protein
MEVMKLKVSQLIELSTGKRRQPSLATRHSPLPLSDSLHSPLATNN